MDSANKEILKILITFLPAFPQSKIQEEGLVLYTKALSHLSPETVKAAMLKCLQNSKFFPAVSEIIEEAGNVERYVNGKPLPTSGEAWEEAMTQVKTAFLYAPWKLSCPEIELAVNRFGKEELCKLEMDNVNTARAQFCRFYSEIISERREKKANETVFAMLSPDNRTKLIAKVERIGKAL